MSDSRRNAGRVGGPGLELEAIEGVGGEVAAVEAEVVPVLEFEGNPRPGHDFDKVGRGTVAGAHLLHERRGEDDLAFVAGENGVPDGHSGAAGRESPDVDADEV